MVPAPPAPAVKLALIFVPLQIAPTADETFKVPALGTAFAVIVCTAELTLVQTPLVILVL